MLVTVMMMVDDATDDISDYFSGDGSGDVR